MGEGVRVSAMISQRVRLEDLLEQFLKQDQQKDLELNE